MPFATVKVTGLGETLARLSNLGPAVDEEVVSTVEWATNLVREQVSENIASTFRNPGRMQSAIRMTVEVLGAGKASGTVSIEGVQYVVHETGGRGPYDIFSHGKALVFQGMPAGGSRTFAVRGARFRTAAGRFSSGTTVFASHVHHPALPQRSYLRRALEQRRAEIIERFHSIGERVRTRASAG